MTTGDSSDTSAVETVVGTPSSRKREPETVEPHTVSLDGDVAKKRETFDPEWEDDHRYAMVAELARGGGGRIAIAVDRKLGRKVAVKRPLEAGGDARLEREALVLARLEHPSIVPIHDAGVDREGSPYYAMKLVGGETLAARIDSSASFDARLALISVVASVADAMAYAHSQRVIHRDLKPGNVLVGEFGEVAVIDWGLAKPLDDVAEVAGVTIPTEGLTSHGSVVGTPAYMAPEQALGEAVDERTDVYAIGAILYHVLSGQLPYGKASTTDALAQVVEGPPPPLEEREPRVARDLGAIVARAMARVPSDRYPTARELADDLRRYQTGNLVAAHRYRPWTRLWRWSRRHQMLLAGLGLTASVALAVGALATRSNPEELCANADAGVRDVWNPLASSEIQALFLGTKLPAAEAAWRIVGSEMDGRARSLGALRISACRGARVTGEDSEELFELRSACLDRRVAEFADFAEWLRHADAAAIGRSRQELGRLSRVEDCADTSQLRDREPLPADPERRAVIAAIDHDLDVLSHLGNLPTAAAAPAVVARAEASGYGPLQARALLVWAGLLTDRGGADKAAELLRGSVVAAERAGDTEARGKALAWLARTELQYHQKPEVARAAAELALAIGEHLRDPDLESFALRTLSEVAHADGKDKVALDDAARGVELQRGKNDPAAWSARFRLGAAYMEVDRFADAAKLYEDLATSEREVIGTADDPEYASLLENTAAIYDKSGDKPRALKKLEEAAAIVDRVLPPTSKHRIQTHMNIATIAGDTGNPDRAIHELETLLTTAEPALGKNHAIVAQVVFDLGEALQHAHRYEDALSRFTDAQQRFATINPTSVETARSLEYAGSMLLELDRAPQAVAALRAAIQILEPQHGLDRDEIALDRGDLARGLLSTGDLRGALAELDKALPVLEANGDTFELGVYGVTRARALWGVGQHDLAKSVAAQARATLAKSADRGKGMIGELDSWEHERK